MTNSRLCGWCGEPVIDGEIAEIGPRAFHNSVPGSISKPTCLDLYEKYLIDDEENEE